MSIRVLGFVIEIIIANSDIEIIVFRSFYLLLSKAFEIMKALLSFLRNTITGGVLFMLPVILIIVLLVKAHEILSKIVAPIADQMPDNILGLDGSRLIAILLMIAICFFSGLLFRSKRIRKYIGKLEDSFLSLIPGYALMKSVTADAIGDVGERDLVPVVVENDGSKKIGFLTEEQGDYCVIFFPEPTKSDSGEVIIMPKSSVKKINAPTNKIAQSMKRFGKGLIQYID